MIARLLQHLFFTLAGVMLATSANAAPLLTVEAVRALTFKEAVKGNAVELDGVITYLRYASDAEFNFNLNESTGGVMIYPKQHVQLQTGQRVKVKGKTLISGHGIRIQADSVEPGDIEALPAPEPLAFESLRLQGSQGRFVEIEATLRSARMESPSIQPRRLALDFGSAKDRITAWVLHFEPHSESYPPGSRLRLKGIPIHWTNDRGQMQSVSLIVNSILDVERIHVPATPQEQTLEEVLLWNAVARAEAPITTTGTVTYVRPGELVVLQEGNHALKVRPIHSDALGITPSFTTFAQGDHVEATGYPAMGGYTVELEDATLKPLSSAKIPEPTNYANAAEVLMPKGLVDRDSQLMRLRGTLTDLRERDGFNRLELTTEKLSFTALLPVEEILPKAVRPGAQLSVSGICNLSLSEERRRLGKPPDQFSLQLENASQLTILREAPWWNKRRLFITASAALSAAVLCASWAILAGRKNARLKAEIARRELAELQLRSDRKRMAGDLHDTLEQTLLATGLQLAAATRSIQHSPDTAAAKLTLANQLLARGRKEVRDAVWDLHIGETQAQPLGLLLKKACEDANAQTIASVSYNGPTGPSSAPTPIASQVLRIVQESLTNALKHAQPSRVQVCLEETPTAIRLTVSDDGCGFDASAIPGPEAGHFGLSSIRERIQRLDGLLHIETPEAGGTIIVAQIPKLHS